MTPETITLKDVYERIEQVQRKLDQLTAIFAEDGELSDEALAALQEARETPDEEYVELE